MLYLPAKSRPASTPIGHVSQQSRRLSGRRGPIGSSANAKTPCRIPSRHGWQARRAAPPGHPPVGAEPLATRRERGPPRAGGRALGPRRDRAPRQRRRPRADPLRRSAAADTPPGRERAALRRAARRAGRLRDPPPGAHVPARSRPLPAGPHAPGRGAGGYRPRSPSRASRSPSSTTASPPSRRRTAQPRSSSTPTTTTRSFGDARAGARRGADVGLAPPLHRARRARGHRLRVHLREPRCRGRRHPAPPARPDLRLSVPAARARARARRRRAPRRLRAVHAARRELADGRRDRRTRTTAVVAYVPYAARWAYEAHVVMREHRPSLLDCEPQRAARRSPPALQSARARLRRPVRAALPLRDGGPPGADHDRAASAAAGVRAGHGHLHVEFYPPLRTADKLKYLAGSEQGAGTFISDTLPEESAAKLREAIARGALSAAARLPPVAST